MEQDEKEEKGFSLTNSRVEEFCQGEIMKQLLGTMKQANGKEREELDHILKKRYCMDRTKKGSACNLS